MILQQDGKCAHLQRRTGPDEHGGEALQLDVLQVPCHDLMVYQCTQCNPIPACTQSMFSVLTARPSLFGHKGQIETQYKHGADRDMTDTSNR